MIYKDIITRDKYDLENCIYKETRVQEHIYVDMRERMAHVLKMIKAGYQVQGPTEIDIAGEGKRIYAKFVKVVNYPIMFEDENEDDVLDVHDLKGALTAYIEQLEINRPILPNVQDEVNRLTKDLSSLKATKRRRKSKAAGKGVDTVPVADERLMAICAEATRKLKSVAPQK